MLFSLTVYLSHLIVWFELARCGISWPKGALTGHHCFHLKLFDLWDNFSALNKTNLHTSNHGNTALRHHQANNATPDKEIPKLALRKARNHKTPKEITQSALDSINLKKSGLNQRTQECLLFTVPSCSSETSELTVKTGRLKRRA